MYSAWDITVREVGGGIWFWTSAFLCIAFLFYIIRAVLNYSRPDRIILAAAFAMLIYFIGSSIRGFLTWMQFFYSGQGWDNRYWIETWPWFGLSVVLNITGAALCVWLLTDAKWRALFTVAMVAVAVAVPFLLWWVA